MSDVKPVLFSGPMIRALLDGRKTMTRRILKPQPIEQPGMNCRNLLWLNKRGKPLGINSPDGDTPWIFTPYAPGQLLWVKETLLWNDEDEGDWCYALEWGKRDGYRIKSARFMNKWASRLTLEVTSVKVERLQDMEGQHPSDSDAIAEGVRSIHHGDGAYYYSAFRDEPHPKNWCDPTDAFSELWDSLNAKRGYGWDTNPWVCAISFIVHQMNVDDFLAQRKAA